MFINLIKLIYLNKVPRFYLESLNFLVWFRVFWILDFLFRRGNFFSNFLHYIIYINLLLNLSCLFNIFFITFWIIFLIKFNFFIIFNLVQLIDNLIIINDHFYNDFLFFFFVILLIIFFLIYCFFLLLLKSKFWIQINNSLQLLSGFESIRILNIVRLSNIDNSHFFVFINIWLHVLQVR